MYGYVYAIIVAIMWGFAAILENSLLEQFSPVFLYVVSGLTFGLSALIVLLWKRASIVPMFHAAKWGDLGYVILMALGALVIANYFFLLALDKTSKPTVVTALAYCAPVFTLLGSILLLQYDVSSLELIGIGTTIVGVVIVTISVT